MIVGGIEIYEDEIGRLLLKKNKLDGFFSLLVYLLMIVIIILTVIYLYKNIGPEAEIDFYLLLVVGVTVLIIITVFCLKLKRIIRNNTSYALCIQNNQVEINGKPFCKNEDLKEIIIQTVSGWEGGEPSYTIGISSEKNFFP